MADGSDDLFSFCCSALQLSNDDQLERARAAWERAVELLEDGAASAALQQVNGCAHVPPGAAAWAPGAKGAAFRLFSRALPSTRDRPLFPLVFVQEGSAELSRACALWLLKTLPGALGVDDVRGKLPLSDLLRHQGTKCAH
jgi:hypothetical protein